MQIDDGRVVTNFIYQAIKSEDITIYGTSDQTRSFSFIEDTLEGLLRVINYKKSMYSILEAK